ncbi:hypothetical protein RI129_010335 [Pyrocoelia pectoralis]|uniref:Lipase domain-containing protein n=1 Tax=Pyrocoelia pectoralis TaxID=417401 RepID=A0AAN7V7T1_9COLE
MSLKIVLALLTLLTKIRVQGVALNQIANASIEDIIKQIPQEDVLGPFIRALDLFLSETQRGRRAPEDNQCKTTLLKFGENELKLSMHPRGFCSYCCKLQKPSRYIRLYFFSKSTGNCTVEIKTIRKKGLLKSAGVKNNVPTVIFIHGFTEHGLGPAPLYIRDAYLSREEDYNIFLVDWGELTSAPWYPQAVTNTKFLGFVLAKFLNFYHSTGELPISNIHIVGFSLGAHAAGFIGKYLDKKMRLPRITALDPALPLFPKDDISNRLSREDADFVDVIHTDAGVFGYPISIGDTDFYPNGGSLLQPGCEVSSLAEKMYIEQLVNCGHVRAWKLYGESVRNPKAFPATKVKVAQNRSERSFKFVTGAYMGFGVNTSSARGNYFLITNQDLPYGKTAGDQETEMNTINIDS